MVFGLMDLWFYGVRVLGFYGFIVLGIYGFMALWCYSSWFYKSIFVCLMPWNYYRLIPGELLSILFSVD